MKKIFKLMAAVLIVSTLAVTLSCKGNDDVVSETGVSSVTVEPATLNLEVGATQTLTATLLPADAALAGVTWESYDKKIATVSPSEGLTTTVTAVGMGSTTIAAVTSNNRQAICEVTVTRSVLLTAITISPDGPSFIEVGDTIYLTATQGPANATNYSPVWTSSAPNVATVSSTGMIAGVGVGTTTVTVSSGTIASSVQVTVTASLSSIVLSSDSVVIDEVGESFQLTANPVPSEAANYSPTWRSGDEDVVTVSSTGLLTATGVGRTVVTVSSGSVSTSISVSVWSSYLSDLSVPEIVSIGLGVERQIDVVVIPSTAKNYDPVWESSDAGVVTVSSTGLIKGVGSGSATVTLTSGSIRKSIVVSVGMLRYSTEGWTADCRNGTHPWNDLGSCGPYPPDQCDGGTVGGEAQLVLDGNIWTGWHSSANALPQCLVVDMKASLEVDWIGIKHRPDAIVHSWYSSPNTWMYIKTVKVYLSEVSVQPDVYQSSWGAPVGTYVFPGGDTGFTMALNPDSKGRYLILLFEDSAVSNYISFTELEVYKKID
jgi:uncharacterized protein YjdB